MRSFFKEFKQFIARGNVMDMAVGVIIGGAFSNIITSLIDDILNPILGTFTEDGGALASSLTIRLAGGGEIMLGSFLNTVLNFLIMAFVVFCLVKAINQFHRKEEGPAAPPAPPEPSPEEKLLMEIRDLLKEKH